jgi:hypothetical protein
MSTQFDYELVDGAPVADVPATLIAGSDGVNARYLKTDVDGRLQIEVDSIGPITVANPSVNGVGQPDSNFVTQIGGTDGTTTREVRLKNASTAADATDPSLVVALSPNSPLPTGTNAIGTVTAAQATAANLNATVVQATAANLNVTAVQPTAANLNVTAVQPTAANLNVTAVQPTAANLNVTAAQPTASNLNATATQGSAAALTGAWPVKITDGTNGAAAVRSAPADGASNAESLLGTCARLVGLNPSGTWDRLRAGVTAVSSTFTGFLNSLPWAVYNTSPTTRANGQGGPLQADAQGNLLVTVAPTSAPSTFSLRDPRVASFSSRVNQIGEQEVQQPIVLVDGPFLGVALDPQFWSTTGSTGTGTTSVSGGVASMTTGATANSSAVLFTTLIARAAPTHPNALRTNVYTPDPGTVNNVRRIGPWDGVNGFGFVINGAPGSGNLGIFAQKAGGAISDVYTLNGDLGATVDWTAGKHTLEVEYLTSAQHFFLDGVRIHTLSPSTTPTTASLNLPIRFTNTNINGSTTNVRMDVWTAAIRKLGNSTARPTYKHLAGAATTVLKISPGTIYTIIIGIPAGIVSVYDNGAGLATNPIAIIDLTGGQTTANTWNFGSLGVDFLNGLTIVATGASDLTVIYE